MNNNKYYMLCQDDNDEENKELIGVDTKTIKTDTKKFPIDKYYDKKNIKKKLNHKKILCINYILNKKCSHFNKCSYAHSIDEQNIDAYRQKTIDILNSNSDLSYIDFSKYEYKFLMKDLLTYTKLCQNCMSNKCTGGYNCKFGSCIQKYLICYDDLNYGHCDVDNCCKIHLSVRNLRPILKKIHNTLDKHNITDNITPNDNNYILDSLISLYENNFITPNDLEHDDNGLFDHENDDDSECSDDECMKSIFSDKIDKLIIYDDN